MNPGLHPKRRNSLTESRWQKEHVTNMYKFAPLNPSSVCSEQEQSYPNLHPLVENTPAEELLAARGANFWKEPEGEDAKGKNF